MERICMSEIQFTILRKLDRKSQPFAAVMTYKAQTLWSLFRRGYIMYFDDQDKVAITLEGKQALSRFNFSSLATVKPETVARKARQKRMGTLVGWKEVA